MSQRRGTTTDQLNNIVQVLQLGRKTGILTVERGEGASLEVGEIIFHAGRIVNARVRELEGQRALQWLYTWGMCRFAFSPTLQERVTKPLPALRQPTQPLLRIESYTPGEIQSVPEILAKGQHRNGLAGSINGTHGGPQRTLPLEEALEFIKQSGLSRLHRHLFLLVDGQRSATELAPLIGRTEDEVQSMLRELERIGVIQQ